MEEDEFGGDDGNDINVSWVLPEEKKEAFKAEQSFSNDERDEEAEQQHIDNGLYYYDDDYENKDLEDDNEKHDTNEEADDLMTQAAGITAALEGAEANGEISSTNKIDRLKQRVWDIAVGKPQRVSVGVPQQSENEASLEVVRVSPADRLRMAHTHVLHALTLFHRAIERSLWCDDSELHSLLLARGPPSQTRPEGLLRWLHSQVDLDLGFALQVSCSGDSGRIRQCGVQQLKASLQNRRAGMEHITLLFIALCRALSLQCRLLVSLHPIAHNKRSSHSVLEASDPTGRKFDLMSLLKIPKCVCQSTHSNTDGEPMIDSIQPQALPSGSKRRRESVEVKSSAKRVSCSSSSALSSMSSSFDLTPSNSLLTSQSLSSLFQSLSSSSSFSSLSSSSASSCCSSHSSSCPFLTSSLSSSTRSSSRAPVPGGHFWCWAEVQSEERKWVPVECVRRLINKPLLADTRSHKAVYVLAIWPIERSLSSSQSAPVVYAKDVTQRYAVSYADNRKLRLKGTWLESALTEVCASPPCDDEEDVEMYRSIKQEPIPNTIDKFRNHPVYVVEEVLKKYEVFYPSSPSPIGFIMTNGKRHAVYLRSAVHTIASRDTWMKRCREVRDGERPFKLMKKSTTAADPETAMECYGDWQTVVWRPSPAANGIVPKNKFGKIDLWSPAHLPPGTSHLPHLHIAQAAKKLGVDYAPAMTGFEIKSGRSHPTMNGIVVCTEHEDAVMIAYKEICEELREKQARKEEDTILKNWTRLIRSTIHRFKLLRESRKKISAKDADDVHFTDDGTLFLESRPHEHEFVTLQDSQTNLRTQVCACGFSTNFEEF